MAPNPVARGLRERVASRQLDPRRLCMLPILKPQEIPFDHPESSNYFQLGPRTPFLATPAAIEMYSRDVILACLQVLQRTAVEHHGIDYVQVFEDDARPENLWFIEDGPGGAITALLPSDH